MLSMLNSFQKLQTLWKQQNKAISIDDLTDLEQKLYNIWKEVLHHDNFSISDSFFEIGGKSILIPSIVMRLKKEYNIDITIIDIFKYPSIKSLVETISGVKLPDEQKPIINITKQKVAKNKQRIRMQKARNKVNSE